MSKGTTATVFPFIFLCLLSSVSGDERFSGNNFAYDSSPFLVSNFKEICLEQADPLLCQYWDAIRRKLNEPELPPASKPGELASENRTSGKEEESFQDDINIEIPFVGVDSNQEKRFSVFRRRNTAARGYKRGPGFRSWGGKRDLIQGAGKNYDKKSKFVSWGGKRDVEVFPENFIPFDGEPAPEKRPKFQNWGGKRSTDEVSVESDSYEKRGPMWRDRGLYLNEPFKKHVPKRPQFQSWGGKRALFPWHQFFKIVRPQPRFLMNGGEKRKFSSWGGKRLDDLENQKPWWGETGEETAKRYVFQNWGGKRGGSEGDPEPKNGEPENTGKERRKREAGEGSISGGDSDPSGGEPREGNARR